MKRAVVEEIKSRLPILEFIEQYIPVEKAGKNYKARCPFHNEKTASFYISIERDSYYCFGCGKKGDVFSFLEEYEGLDFKHALIQLAEKTNVPLDEYKVSKTQDNKNHIYEVLTSACTFFERSLEASTQAQTYLKERGVNVTTLKIFQIGYAPADWKQLYLYLKEQGFSDELIKEAGLAKEGNYGLYDRFRNRVMFPFMDSSGRVIGFSGRTIETDSKEAKYINSPETPVFQKGEVFYGLYQAKDSIRKEKKVLFVEGQMDVIMTRQAGVGYVVASSGTAFSGDELTKEGTASHLSLIKRFTSSIYFAFDNDSAGIKAMYRATRIALENQFTVFCIPIVDQKDFAEIALRHPEKIAILMNKKVEAIFFFVMYLKNHVTKQLLVKGISEKIWPLLESIQSPLDQARLISQIAPLIQISENALIEDFKLYTKNKKKVTILFSQVGSNKIIIQDSLLQKMFSLLFFSELNNMPDIYLEYRTKLQVLLSSSFDELEEECIKKREESIFKIEKTFTDEETIKKDIAFIYKSFEQEFYKQKLIILQSEIAQDELLGLDTKDRLQEVANISQKKQ